MTATRDRETVQVRLLGGFRAERAGGRLACEWPRRTAKTLTKLLATCPGHTLHREQIIETLWPGVDIESALNTFGKALHAARHALEPQLRPRGCSQYLRLTDGMLSLDTERVVIDADRFERMAKDALQRQALDAYEAAIAAYAGELLPEDRYEDWCAERRVSLAELRVRLLLGAADALEERGAGIEAAERLRQVIGEDPTREEVHRRLIRMWAETGNRDQAVRQFHVCREALRRHLELTPQPETLALYEDVLAGRVVAHAGRDERIAAALPPTNAPEVRESAPLIGRRRALQQLLELLERGGGTAPMLLLTGEAGVGKTRLLEELAGEAARSATVLRGEVGAHVSQLPYGPVAVALEAFVAGRPESERCELVRRHPPLARFVPSLAVDPPPAGDTVGLAQLDLLLAVVRALSDLAGARPLLFVVDDLHEADPPSLAMLRYLAHLARRRRWLLVAAARQEDLPAEGAVARTLESMVREGLCAELELPCLSRTEARSLVRALCSHEPLGDGETAEICGRAGGNPLFIEALVEDALGRRGPCVADARRSLPSPPGSAVPPRIRFLVNTQLNGLDDASRRIVALLAAAGAAEISLEELLGAAAALESPILPAAVFDGLDRALSLRILDERRRGYGFRHELVRSVICRELSRHRLDELQAAWRSRAIDHTHRLRLTAAGR
jgi:DNA-binding SARP family transcriptional activator